MGTSQHSHTFRLVSSLLSVAMGVAVVALTPPSAHAIAVDSKSPDSGAVGVPVDTDVTVTFDIAAVGVNAQTFTLRSTAGAVAAAVTGNVTNTSWTLNPTGNLERDTTYTAALDATISDANGRTLPATSWSFTTAPPPDVTNPTVVERRPDPGAADVDVRADVSATFSEPVLGVDDSAFTLRSPGGRLVDAVVDRVGTTNRWILDPTASLAQDTRYTVGLLGAANAIRDAAGNPLADTEWSFTTAGGEEEPGDDVRRPRVVNESPRDGATGVSRFTDVRVRFSEAVFGVNTRTFRLTTRRGSVVRADVFRTRRSTRWVLDPHRRLARGARYFVVLRGGGNGISDATGNSLPTTRWSFRTSR